MEQHFVIAPLPVLQSRSHHCCQRCKQIGDFFPGYFLQPIYPAIPMDTGIVKLLLFCVGRTLWILSVFPRLDFPVSSDPLLSCFFPGRLYAVLRRNHNDRTFYWFLFCQWRFNIGTTVVFCRECLANHSMKEAMSEVVLPAKCSWERMYCSCVAGNPPPVDFG